MHVLQKSRKYSGLILIYIYYFYGANTVSILHIVGKFYVQHWSAILNLLCMDLLEMVEIPNMWITVAPAKFLALLCATAQQSYCRHAGVRRQSSSVRPSVVRPSVRP